LSASNGWTITVLKNHLVVEQFVNEFLLASGKKADGKFSDKIERCKSLKPTGFTDKDWAVLTKANRLRNKIGHTLDQAEIKSAMDELRVAYLAALSDQQKPHAEKLDNNQIAADAFQHCGAFMVAATETVPSSGPQ
jgi:hypothetical protein